MGLLNFIFCLIRESDDGAYMRDAVISIANSVYNAKVAAAAKMLIEYIKRNPDRFPDF